MKHHLSKRLVSEVDSLAKKVEEIEAVISSLSLSKEVTKENEKCKSTLNKSDLAQLFYILMDESILYFDDFDQIKNRSKFQKFMINNLTFSGNQKFQTPIDQISKQFSEAKGFTYRSRHLKFIDQMIQVLNNRRERLSY